MTEEEPFRVTNEKSTLMILKTRLRDLYSVKDPDKNVKQMIKKFVEDKLKD